MYIVMHGGKDGKLYSTTTSIGMKPLSFLKQLIKKFPKEKTFYVCCCYSKYCFPNGKVEYNGATLIPMLLTVHPVHAGMYLDNGGVRKLISSQWETPLPWEGTDEEAEHIKIKDFCIKNSLSFKNLGLVEKEDPYYEGIYRLYFLKGNQEDILKKLNLNLNILYNYFEDVFYDDDEFLRAVLKFIFPNYRLRYLKIGNIIYPNFLEKKVSL